MTATTTVPPPAPTCTYPEDNQEDLRGTIKPGAGANYTASEAASAQTCYANAKNLKLFWSNDSADLQPYVFLSYANPGSSDEPGECRGYQG